MDGTEPVPPAGLTRRAAEVTQALIEAQTTSGGAPVTVTEICIYAWPAAAAATEAALTEACQAGLAGQDGSRWYATGRAREIRTELEEWYYAT
jgi:hypothetical protein